MNIGEELARARELSDEALLASLTGFLGSSRRLVALVVAHLGEVEARRLHLLAGYGSMFEYCTVRLGMSEDEAYRRIEVARLARCFPALLERLACGGVSLSVAALLKPHLTEANHAALLKAVSGKTVARAREVLADWFPQPDVPPSIRKLPERRSSSSATEPPGVASASPLFASTGHGTARCSVAPSVETRGPATSALSDGLAQTEPTEARPAGEHGPASTPVIRGQRLPPSRATRGSANIAPLSPGRFKVTFTASAEIKQKLELARDLLRHAVPGGDLASIVGRALDLLIEKTEKRRFAKTSQPKAKVAPAQTASQARERAASAPSRYLPAAVRRAVHERDGTRCTWQAPDGTRCNSRAWLEHDHIIPHGQGGPNDPANIHPYCRAHNRVAAEQAYGKTTISRIIARRRATRARMHERPRP